MVRPQQYDLFISFAEPDSAWVHGFLMPALEEAGIAWTAESAFALGVPRLEAFAQAVAQSRRILLVLSPAYLANDTLRFVDILAQTYGLDGGVWPVIPLLLEAVKLPPRLALLTALDATDPNRREAALARLVAELGRTLPQPTAPPPCPYPGMSPFAEQDSERFFGRDREIEDALQRLRLHPFLALIGPSGSGKSSLIFSGLLPALRTSTLFGKAPWIVRSMRPGETPQIALQVLLSDLIDFPSLHPTAALGAARLLLIIDQFEEIFSLSDDALAFQQTLRQMTRLQSVYLILAIRSDFYSDLMTSALWSEIQAHRFELAPLGPEGLRQAIVLPAEAIGVFVESALVERLVADAGREPGILPFVQETLVLLWEKLERHYLPLRAYEAIILSRRAYGDEHTTGLQVAMARHAEAAFTALSPGQQKIAQRIYLRLVQFGEGRAHTRRRQSVASLQTHVAEADFEPTLSQLAKRRLLTVTSEATSGERLVDIAHETLIQGWPRLKRWVSDLHEAEEHRRRLEAKAAEWVRLGSKNGGLLDEIELAEATVWLESAEAQVLGASPSLKALMQASYTARNKARNLLRGRRIALGALAICMFIVVLSLMPVESGWHSLTHLPFTSGDLDAFDGLRVSHDLSDPDRIFVFNARGDLFRSEDGGQLWQPIAPLLTETTTSLAAARASVYAATTKALYQSKNGGDTWQAVSTPGGQAPATVTLDPEDPQHAFISTRQGFLYETTDGGANWEEINHPSDISPPDLVLDTNGKHLLLTDGEHIWIQEIGTNIWRPFAPQTPISIPVLDLAMIGRKGRFLMALGAQGIGDADVNGALWFPLPDAPPPAAIFSLSASPTARYAGMHDDVLCWRHWTWTDLDWWRRRFGLATPCS